MDEPSPASTTPDAPDPSRVYRCSYCGGSLDLRYHFCIHCSKVYREPDEKVYGAEPRPAPSVETRISREGRPALDFFCVLAVLVASLSLLQIFAKDHLGAALVAVSAAVGGLTTAYAVRHWGDIAHLFRGIRIRPALFLSLPILAGLLVLNRSYHELVRRALGSPELDSLFEQMMHSLHPALLVVTVCVFPAIFEEIGFRGLVQERLVLAAGPPIGFLATAFLFTLLHFNVLSAPYLFVLGLFFSWVRAETASIYPTMALHFLHNFVVLSLVREVW
ncbi:MAG: CPBP family intramembrane metalloprotease [Planctomycetes bacterium]|nr:CPBP family intramembrane metalloprotease [Planctomycetota bacterium]